MNAIQFSLGSLLLLGVAMLGCSDHDRSAVRVEGNVVSVENPSGVSARGDAQAGRRLASSVSLLSRAWLPEAMAQSSCGASVERVLGCLATERSSGGFVGTCAPVRSNCEFQVEIRLAAPGDTLDLFFCFDVDGNATCDPSEPFAPYLNFDKVGNFCNGDLIRVSNVAIDFSSETCTGSPASVIADGCLPPDPTPVPTRPSAPPEGTPNDTQAPPTATPAPPATTPPPAGTPPPTATRPPSTPIPLPTTVPPPPQCVPIGGSCGGEVSTCCPGTICRFQGNDGPPECTLCSPSGLSCESSGDCCDESDVCRSNGRCGACVPTGGDCESSADCCGGAECAEGTCAAPCTPHGESGCNTTPCCDEGDMCGDDFCFSV